MLGTYASFLVLIVGSALVGQAIFAACGRSEWSRLAPAVGLAALCALAWWTVRLPGEGTASMVAIALAAAGSAACLRGRRHHLGRSMRPDLPVAVAALALASLPFIVEGRFGILGTGLNPDMSQHLFAADRLATAGSERLISVGYPLGPHSIVVALAKLGPSTVEGFDGLMLAVSVAACLAPLALLDRTPAWRRGAGALCIGLAYLVAAYFVQGAFKETMQALFLLAFAIGLMCLAQAWPPRGEDARRPLRAIPLAVLAVGSVYVYSFPGLVWLAAGALWAAIELGRAARQGAFAEALRLARLAAPAALIAVGVLVLAVIPELGRMIEFARFETFDPDGAGLGNLFNRLSPLEALGIWPSGDFRIEPGDGFAPAVAFYLGAAIGLGALGFGLVWWWRRGESAVSAALAAALALWLYALIAGTAYQEAKALVLAAPLVAMISVRACLHAAPTVVAIAFLIAAGGSSVLALANGPVGPSGYSPQLAELRTELGGGPVIVLARSELLESEHGRDFLAWELRGNRVCVVENSGQRALRLPAGRLIVVEEVEDGYADAGSSLAPTRSAETCPLIADGARADPAADD